MSLWPSLQGSPLTSLQSFTNVLYFSQSNLLLVKEGKHLKKQTVREVAWYKGRITRYTSHKACLIFSTNLSHCQLYSCFISSTFLQNTIVMLKHTWCGAIPLPLHKSQHTYRYVLYVLDMNEWTLDMCSATRPNWWLIYMSSACPTFTHYLHSQLHPVYMIGTLWFTHVVSYVPQYHMCFNAPIPVHDWDKPWLNKTCLSTLWMLFQVSKSL